MDDDRLPARPLMTRAAFLLPNILTLFAVFCGLTAIRLSGEGQTGLAMAAIFAAVILDAADGFAARKLGAVTAIGAELDSLADFLNFGAAPALLLYQRDLRLLGWAGWFIAAVYVLATGLRLARYNVQSKNANEGAPREFFCGLPSTGAAAAVLIAGRVVNTFFPPALASFLVAGAAMAASALMLSTLRVPSLSTLLRRSGLRSRNR